MTLASGTTVRNVTTSGSINSYGAYNGVGVAPACVFHLASLASAPSGAQEELRKELDALKEKIQKIEERLKEVEA